MQKKFLSLVLTLAMMLCTFMTAFAAAETAEIDISVETFTVTAKVSTEADGVMTALLKNADNTVWVDMAQSAEYVTEDGKNVYTFLFVMPTDQASDEYTVTVGGCVAESFKSFDFKNVGDIVNFYNALNEAPAAATGEEKSIYDLLTGEDNPLYYDFTAYKALPPSLLDVADAEIEKLELAATMETVEEVDKAFTEAMDSLMQLALVVNENAASEAWDAAVKALIESESIDGKFYAKLTADKVRSFMDAGSIEELNSEAVGKVFDAACLLAVADELDYVTLGEAFDYYLDKDVFEMNASDYKSIKADDDLSDDFFKALKKVTLTTIADLEDKAEDIAEDVLDDDDSGSSSSGSGSSSSSSSSSGGSSSRTSRTSSSSNGNYTFSGDMTLDSDENGDTVYDATFSDVPSSHYASTAITSLAKKGVLLGRGDGTFAPNDEMTREEFVKLIIAAFNALDESATVDFADVPADRWSYVYVASAVKNGLVTGVDAEHFNPEGLVTREDMAVILDRVCTRFGYAAAETNSDFSDASDIADYAKDAVFKLAGIGIINGMGDGTFLPKNAVTRAQAAKAVYALLTLLEV